MLTSIERLIPNQLDYQTDQQELLLDLRGGGSDPSEFIIKILLIWTMSKNYKPTDGFQPKPTPKIHQYSGRQGHQGHIQPNPRIAAKLQENPVNRNNPGQGSYRSSNHLSMDKLANSLSPEYSEFQRKYYSEFLPKRFDTNNYSAKEFKKLAKDSRIDDVTRVSIDEAITIVQAKLENLVIKPTRLDMEIARRVDLDYKVQGPAPFTHFDVKNPVGSEILKKQGQTISLEDMSYKIGQKIVAQKHKFVGLENGPVGPENVGHIVDLCYVPSSKKAIVKQNVLQEPLDKSSDAGLIFLNDI
uniref:Uncharacterized protein n=1 Tax=Climaconeis cf. scalaris TaxID=2846828 RepID=A0A8F8X8I8_9STRA|nr:hypothetical protein [Climaconeis cf. scalaris]QYB19338.1 hypothetical protein [Climaconeis cf. scalaris]